MIYKMLYHWFLISQIIVIIYGGWAYWKKCKRIWEITSSERITYKNFLKMETMITMSKKSSNRSWCLPPFGNIERINIKTVFDPSPPNNDPAGFSRFARKIIRDFAAERK